MDATDHDLAIGAEIIELCERLYPICRSITGDGVRRTLEILAEYTDIQQFEVPSGRAVFDWEVPKEWNLTEAYVEDSTGTRVIEVDQHSLHVMSYSTPVDEEMDLEELQPHLFSLPDQPDLIPYRTSYFAPNWGFCLAHEKRAQLKPGKYRVKISSSLSQGHLTYGEARIPGRSEEEILISTHICHPSLANDNLSGIGVATFLARSLSQLTDLEYGVRLIFVPGTIGAITWLAENPDTVEHIVAGLVLSGVGDLGQFTYKLSRAGDGLLDRIIPAQLEELKIGHEVRPFVPYGYDERQFCSPGINLPVGCLMRTPFGEYPEYHTSGDNLSFVDAKQLGETHRLVKDALLEAQKVRKYVNLQPCCEPQLGKRGLYDSIGGDNDTKRSQMALLWMLAYSDGVHSTLDICEKSDLDIDDLVVAADRLVVSELLKSVSYKLGE